MDGDEMTENEAEEEQIRSLRSHLEAHGYYYDAILGWVPDPFYTPKATTSDMAQSAAEAEEIYDRRGD